MNDRDILIILCGSLIVFTIMLATAYLLYYLVQSIKKPEPYMKPRWKPKEGEKYFVCSVNFIKRCWDGDVSDHIAYEHGNCFQTEEEAQKVFDKITQLLKDHHDGK